MIEVCDSGGNTRTCKIFRDITLPPECDASTVQARLDQEVMMIEARKKTRNKDDFIPLNQRPKVNNLDEGGFDDSFR